ncbi:MAG: ribosome maturation factor RimP [Acidobacteriota bacterium]|nr:ribosome maturation factor RimP [Acidobacteriota bacterium]
MDKLRVSERVREIAERVAGENGLELVHVDVAGSDRNPAVRIFIDKPGGVTVDDCTTVNHTVGTILDVEDFIPSAYTLEVSSPGLERELYSLRDYEKYAGNLAKLKARQPVGNQRNFRGRIVGVEGETVIFDDKTNGRVEIPFDVIAKANLEIDVEEEFRKAAEREKENQRVNS